MALEQKEYVTDLKPVIFKNESDIDFVISDNPLVMTNRFHFQRVQLSLWTGAIWPRRKIKMERFGRERPPSFRLTPVNSMLCGGTSRALPSGKSK